MRAAPLIMWMMACLLVAPIIPGVSAAGHISLVLSPSELTLCDPARNATLTASSIVSDASVVLMNVTLSLEANSSVSLVQGPLTAYLGDILPGFAGGEHAWTLACDEASPGHHLLRVRYAALANGTPVSGFASSPEGGNASADVLIAPAPPRIVSIRVAGASEDSGQADESALLRTSSSTSALTVRTDEAAQCRLGSSDAAFGELPLALTPDGPSEGTSHALSLSFDEGPHRLFVRCRDVAGNAMTSSRVMELIVDRTLPTLSVRRPLSWETATTFPLDITTSEPAECRYSTMVQSFEGMAQLDAAGLSHSVTLTLPEGVYALRAACRDLAGNLAEKSVTFEVDIPPDAAVSLGEGPLRPGLHMLNLTASEPLLTAPTLSYALSGVDGMHTVMLEGMGASWRGYLLLQDTGAEHLGSFSFSGTNQEGHSGNVITSGKLFIVDAKPPAAPVGLDAAVENGSIVLVWKHEGEDAQRFVVYGGATAFIGYADYLASVQAKRFTYPIPGEGTLYFRVAAVDATGNEGQLSDELAVRSTLSESGWRVWASPPRGAANSSSGAMQPGGAFSQDGAATLDSLSQEVSSLLLDARAAQETLAEATEEFSGLGALGLAEELKKAVSELSGMETELEGLASGSAGQASAEQLRLFRLRVARLKRSTPRLATVHDRLSLEQALSPEELTSLVKEHVLSSDGSAAAVRATAAAIGAQSSSEEATELFQERYLAALAALQGQLRVDRVSASFDIEYLDGSTASRTYLRDEIEAFDMSRRAVESSSTKEAPEGAQLLLMVLIPKSVASDAKDITVLTQGYEVVEEDPLIAVPAEGLVVEMVLPGRIDEARIRQIRTFLAYDPEQFGSAVEGSSSPWASRIGLLSRIRKSASSLAHGIGPEQAILFAGIALILGLLGYYLHLHSGGSGGSGGSGSGGLVWSALSLLPGRKAGRGGAGGREGEEEENEREESAAQPAQPEKGPRSAQDQIARSLGELERLSDELDEEDTRGMSSEALRRLHDYEMVKALLREAEQAKESDDAESAGRVYADLSRRYNILAPAYKERVAGKCMTLHEWLTQAKQMKMRRR